MSKVFRPGSMGAAEQKANKIFFIVAALVWIALILLVSCIPNYLNDFFNRAPGIANFLGLIVMAFSYFIMLIGKDKDFGRSIWVLALISGIVLAFGIALACGFNFSLFGIAERP